MHIPRLLLAGALATVVTITVSACSGQASPHPLGDGSGSAAGASSTVSASSTASASPTVSAAGSPAQQATASVPGTSSLLVSLVSWDTSSRTLTVRRTERVTGDAQPHLNATGASFTLTYARDATATTDTDASGVTKIDANGDGTVPSSAVRLSAARPAFLRLQVTNGVVDSIKVHYQA